MWFHQRSDWVDHKEECASLKRCAPQRPPHTVRLLARLLRRQARDRGTDRAAADAVWDDIQRLQSHRSELPTQVVEGFGAACTALHAFTGDVSRYVRPGTLADNPTARRHAVDAWEAFPPLITIVIVWIV